jgi:hypothetical protein
MIMPSGVCEFLQAKAPNLRRNKKIIQADATQERRDLYFTQKKTRLSEIKSSVLLLSILKTSDGKRIKTSMN